MQQTPVGDWQAYLKRHLITDYAPYLDSQTDAQNFAFFGTTLSGTPKQRAPGSGPSAYWTITWARR